MKQVYIFTPFMTGYGGTETVLTNLFHEYNRSPERDYHMKLICIGGYEDDSWTGSIKDIQVINLGKNRTIRALVYLFCLPFIMLRILKGNPDVVISTNPIMWSLAYWIKAIFHKKYKVISWYHYSLEAKSLPKILLKSADTYLAISSGISHQIQKYGVHAEKIKTIFNPIFKNKIVVSRTEVGETPELIYVGRIMLDGQKNMRQIIDALANVKGKWRLSIYGDGDIEAVSNYIDSKGISDNISFMGFKKNMWSTLDKMDCLLLSSKYEGLPMVLNEAISVGIPVISTNCETGPEDIVNSENGILVKTNSTLDYQQAIQKVVDRKVDFQDSIKIKKSISKFYSENYFNVFMKSIGE
ncbi:MULTISPECIES: glycosyltransferase [Lactiplantibacillus]|nr:Putative glycosyltransferase EpsD [Lactiplantibacillus plantarum]